MQKQFDLSDVRNRIVERRKMKPSELLDHPNQWRDHSESQANALAGVLHEIGITDTLKAWYSERANGALVTWDGHLRKSLDPDLEWDVDITDLTDEEADYALATHDPVSAMAMSNAAALDALLSSVSSGNEAVQEMFADIAAKAGLYLDADKSETPFSEFDPDSAAFEDYISFKFGDHSGRVSKEVYESFDAKYKALRETSESVMLDDVLREWLNV